MKKIISLVLAITLCMALTAPAFADNETEPEGEVAEEVVNEATEADVEQMPAGESVEGSVEEPPAGESGEESGEGTPAGEAEVVETGTKGSVSYTLRSNGELTVSGSGKIPKDAFKGCEDITTVIIGEDVAGIGDNAFQGCSKITSVSLPGTLLSIGIKAFSECSSLESIEIPDSVTTLGNHAFEHCGKLTYAKLPAGLQTVSNGMFKDCGLKEVIIPSSVKTIGEDAFNFCRKLERVSITEGVTEIEPFAFMTCESLTEIKLPRSVTHIGEGAFEDCKALTATIFRTSALQIEALAFEDVAKLIVYVPADWNSDHNTFDAADCVYKTDFFGTHSLGSVSFTLLDNGELTVNGSGAIPKDAFKGCEDITSVIIREGITGIGDNAFQGCSNITSVIIREGITAIGDNAFQGCSSIASVSLPGTLLSIGIRAFSACSSLESIWLPDGVTTLGDNAFDSCGNLTYAKLPAGLQTVGNAVFNNCGLSEVSIPKGVPVIGKSMFSGCPLEEVVIPVSVKKIDDNAFKNCRKLKGVFIAKGVTEIGDSAFANCASLAEIELPHSVTLIHGNAFAGCTALTATIHRTTATQINNNAFDNVAKLIVLVPTDWSGDRDTFNAKDVVYDEDESGTADDPYKISTPEKLARLAREVAKGLDHAGEYFKLTESFYYDGAPIGKLNTGIFKGIFDGAGYTLTVDIDTGDSCASLFPHTEDATIKNLEIKGTISGTESVGGVVGLANRNTLIDNCHVAASVTGSSVNVGGVVGMLYGGSTVSNCRVDGTVLSNAFTVGGIVGWLHGDSRVINCVKTGETIGDWSVGGIVGYALGTTAIINCASFGKVTASSGNCGGIVGIVKETDFDEVTALKLYSCYANCIIDCNTDNGYICGRNEYTSASPVDAQHLYYVMTGAKNALGHNSPEAKPVTFINRAGILNDLNTFAAGYGDASLTAWSRVKASICPASCSRFELAVVYFEQYTPDVSEKEVTLDINNTERNGVKATGTLVAGIRSWNVAERNGTYHTLTIEVPKNCSIFSVTYHCGYSTTDGHGYPNVSDYQQGECVSLKGCDCTINIPDEDIVHKMEAHGAAGRTSGFTQDVESVTVRYRETSATASVLSEGNVWIVAALAAAAVIAVGALVVVKKKRV